eukprot:CAMPEP_0176371210 /NCGR_PEP_ID=MMETSP0126-20121128/24538_1 /TAXON_ID=141414 ORGANISM="Strombidinopsis acuminatum, Strain SPMC142" /NCGR_SAMPLE_ID=MMETSP0126 /ASSEMBLY_ACC=CAM_ASM_000229 /LENGTH=117 /DNA_ID=CAMNT_0017730575 /DNA_START=1 /DNA_END=354 /DNA_ORIENTATION=+
MKFNSSCLLALATFAKSDTVLVSGVTMPQGIDAASDPTIVLAFPDGFWDVQLFGGVLDDVEGYYVRIVTSLLNDNGSDWAITVASDDVYAGEWGYIENNTIPEEEEEFTMQQEMWAV